jgi:hypothetical protein
MTRGKEGTYRHRAESSVFVDVGGGSLARRDRGWNPRRERLKTRLPPCTPQAALRAFVGGGPSYRGRWTRGESAGRFRRTINRLKFAIAAGSGHSPPISARCKALILLRRLRDAPGLRCCHHYGFGKIALAKRKFSRGRMRAGSVTVGHEHRPVQLHHREHVGRADTEQ